MKKIKNILVPLDGSSASLKGLKLALTLAKGLDAKIFGVNIIRFSNGFQFPVSSEIKKMHIKSAEGIVSEAQKIAKKEKIPFVGKIIKADNIGGEIVKISKTKKVDLIIIGSRGPYPGSETFLGSVANYVLHKTNVPITIVK
ncbi:universal stress protein [Nitrosopumilus sp. K4]|nr:universal stress protein [Nitrosopumilus sp. K4]